MNCKLCLKTIPKGRPEGKEQWCKDEHMPLTYTAYYDNGVLVQDRRIPFKDKKPIEKKEVAFMGHKYRY